MKQKFFSIMCAALMVAGCSNSDDDNRAMEYDTLNVGFKGNKTSGTWLQGDEVGIFAFCTRNDEQDTPMSANANARYTVAAESESAMLAAATDGDAAIAISNDHNYRFYAYYPYSDKVTDLKAIGVSAPAEQPYTGEANGSFYVAQKTVTTIVPTVELEFKNIFATLVLNLPNNLLSEDGNSTVKKLTLKPATAENFNDALAVSGTYDLTTGTLTKTSADAKQITVDFGEQGLQVNYTKVPIVINPVTIPEGGFEVVFTDMNGEESSQIILAGDAGKAIAAGEVSEQQIRSNFADEMERKIEDITRTAEQLLNDNSYPLLYRGAVLADNFVIEGKIDITGTGGDSPHIAFNYLNNSLDCRMLLWDRFATGEFRERYIYKNQADSGWKDALHCYVFEAGQTLTLTFKVVMVDNNAYLYVNGELVLVFVNATATGKAESLRISSSRVACHIYDMKAVTKDADGQEYETAIAAVKDDIDTYSGREDGAYRP